MFFDEQLEKKSSDSYHLTKITTQIINIVLEDGRIDKNNSQKVHILKGHNSQCSREEENNKYSALYKSSC